MGSDNWDKDRWERVAALFEAASELPPARWSAFLEESCGQDRELQREVESLLRQPVSRDGVLESIAGGVQSIHECLPLDGPELPSTVGPYRILRIVGEGGMGVVYEAEQDHPRRVVALKVMRAGPANANLLRRFELECDALARLQHPGIAQIYESGAAHSAFGTQPYFAMEFIRGAPLLEYAAGRGLGVRERLGLAIKVCEAVHHAHERGIVHRDLKPGNILVDEAGQPKVLDFGVARIADTHLPGQTEAGQVVGTLAYMSPEQVLPGQAELDARSDVYALGVIVYELLAGRLPYRIGATVLDAARTIRDEAPVPLGRIVRECRGDLEIIVNTALEKDPARRYASAAGLALDLRRYLDNEPIAARRPTVAYQAEKFVRRHTRLVAAVAALFVVLAAGIVVSTGEAFRANRAEQAAKIERDRAIAAERSATAGRDLALRAEQTANAERLRAEQERGRALAQSQRADTQSAVAQAVNEFLQNGLLAQAGARVQASPNTKPDPNLTVRAALDRAAGRIQGKFADQPAVEAAIRETIGTAYRDLGLFAEAVPHLERTLELRRRTLGPEHADTVSSMQELGVIYPQVGRLGDAERLLNEAFETSRRLRGADRLETLLAMAELGTFLNTKGEYGRAEALLVRALDGLRRVRGEDHVDTLVVMSNLATVYTNQNKYRAAEAFYRQSFAIRRRVLGVDHPSTLMSLNSLAVVYRNEGKYADAEPLLSSALDARRRSLGDDHLDTLASMNSLALLYVAEGRYSDAEPLLESAVSTARRVLGEDNINTLRCANSMAELRRRQNRLEEAESIFRKVLEARRRVVGANHPTTLAVLESLGEIELERRHHAEAEPLLREALAGRVQVDTKIVWMKLQSLAEGAAMASKELWRKAA